MFSRRHRFCALDDAYAEARSQELLRSEAVRIHSNARIANARARAEYQAIFELRKLVTAALTDAGHAETAKYVGEQIDKAGKAALKSEMSKPSSLV